MLIEKWLGIGMVFVIGIFGMRQFRNTWLQMVSFLFPMLVAVSLAGYIELFQSTMTTMLTLLVLVVLVIVAVAGILCFSVLRKIGHSVSL